MRDFKLQVINDCQRASIFKYQLDKQRHKVKSGEVAKLHFEAICLS